jgi:4-cresol dehydrogenase (hydroxylating)
MGDLEAALAAWRDTLGPEHVSTDPAVLARAATATFATAQRVPVVLRPGNRQEVQECVRIANRHGVPLYPISTGLNWGYGSGVPARDGCAVLALGRLNRIVEFDEDLAYITVEPGVTQQQVYEFLRERKSRLLMSMTGGSSDGSLIGNTMERGTALSYYWNRFAHACALEIVLPTGECVHTGFDRFEGAAAARLDRWGVGPAFDGLFSQSNLGIVTRMTFWLMPPPVVHQTFFFTLCEENWDRFEAAVDALRGLALGQPVRIGLGLFNDFNFLILVHRQYPWEQAGGRTPMPPEVRRALRQQYKIGLWNGNGALYSPSPAHARADRRLVRNALRGKVDRLFFLYPSKIRLLRAISRPYRWISKIDINPVLDQLTVKNPDLGVPAGNRITLPYWRKRSKPPEVTDPEGDRCGVVWCSPVVPYQGRHLSAAVRIIEETALAHGLEPSIGARCSRERTIDLVVGLMYDRDVPGEDERAMACHDEVLSRLIARGYLPERLGIQSMDALPPARDDSPQLLARIKGALDPNRILAPGRYIQ